MHTPARQPVRAPDLSYVPWLLVALMWLAATAQQSGMLAWLVDSEGIEVLFDSAAAKYLAEIKRVAYLSWTFGSLGCFVYLPRWSWLAPLLMLLGTVALELSYSSFQVSPSSFLLSSVLPLLLYGLALSIAWRRSRLFLHSVVRTESGQPRAL